MPNPNPDTTALEDEDTVGVRAPDLSDDPETGAKGDDATELDDDDLEESDDLEPSDDLADGVLDDDKGVGG